MLKGLLLLFFMWIAIGYKNAEYRIQIYGINSLFAPHPSCFCLGISLKGVAAADAPTNTSSYAPLDIQLAEDYLNPALYLYVYR